ncbi:hypothetical protein M8C21_031910 [Ambrosia artemisiifolia]|uniref:WRKY domain-containing protein n=1 Tax=Ambrosia artemisiifolia TaxID=4212 RepID=A0AAD5GD99_AMBAR|nr:hypothetical protein M8C21_031910 [Ambrosia artemisiifolia]
MAVDFVGLQSIDHHLNLMFQLSSSDHNFHNVSVSSLKRTGHARFRRAPSSFTVNTQAPSTSSQSEDKTIVPNKCLLHKSVTETTSSPSTSSSSSVVSFSVSGNIDGSVSNGKQFSSSLGIVSPALTFSSKKPPLPASHRKRCSADRPVASVHGSGRSGCHCCSKRRKSGSKREIRRVPIIGSKVASIPADDYSWKKYGEKKIDGSPYPRVYYKCITGKGCPARKRVELATDDSKMLLVTYDGEHRHSPSLVSMGLTGLSVQSK